MEKCECGHSRDEHLNGSCQHFWIFPDVLRTRQCGCESFRPKEGKTK